MTLLPKPLVSVIIIFLNAEKFLEEAIESVLAQTYVNWELFLVDDGSVDRSTQIALGFASQQPNKIRYLEHENHQNYGMSASRNLGIRHAGGDYVAFLDADDIWLPDKLIHQVGIISAHPEVGMIYGNTLYWHSWSGATEGRKRDHTPILGVKPNEVLKPPQLLQLYLNGQAAVPCTCSILLRGEIVKRVGGFEESFHDMYEDQAFYAKVCLSTLVLATDDCLAWYRQHPESSYSAALTTGHVHALHFHYLNWLKEYCNNQEVKDEGLWRTIHRQLWLYSSPSHCVFPGLSLDGLRRLKKWILRAEEHLVPPKIRTWLWTHK